MKIIVLHGENTSKSFERLTKFINVAMQRGWKINHIDSGVVLSDALRLQELFSDKKLFVVDNIRSLSKKDYDFLLKSKDDVNLVIYSEKTLTKAQMSAFPKNAKFELFTIPKKIWLFLESIYPRNAKNCLNLFRHVCRNEVSVEMLLVLMARQLREIYLVKKGIKKMPSWKLAKITNQAKKFDNTFTILQILNELAEIDIKAKTSNCNLEDELAFLLVRQLQ